MSAFWFTDEVLNGKIYARVHFKLVRRILSVSLIRDCVIM